MTAITAQLWLTVAEAAPLIGDKPDAIYRDIRENQFPFEFKRSGKRIKISARSIGLIASDQPAQKESGGTETTEANQ